jgi:hypothetical protein
MPPPSGNDLGAGATGQHCNGVGQRADRGDPPRPLDEPARGLDLRTHRTSRELRRAELSDGGAGDGRRARRTVCRLDGVDIGQQEQRIGIEGLGQQRCGEILVDHGLDPFERSIS